MRASINVDLPSLINVVDIVIDKFLCPHRRTSQILAHYGLN